MSYSCTILIIDGGGIRGVIPAYILSQLETALGKAVFQCFDVVGGTSTGGLIALALTTPSVVRPGEYGLPRTASSVLGIYEDDEGNLFKKFGGKGQPYSPYYYSTAQWMEQNISSLNLSTAKQNLQNIPGALTKQVFATSYSLNSPVPEPYLFNWVDAAAVPNGPDDYFVWEAALATSSAPIYFPLANVGAGSSNLNIPPKGESPTPSNATFRWVVDGGVVANNPSLFGLAWALRNGHNLNDVLIVSIGTGVYNGGISVPKTSPNNSYPQGAWGELDWLSGADMLGHETSPLASAFGMSNQQAPDQLLKTMMPDGNYLRLEPTLTFEQSPMDGKDVPALIDVAQSYIGSGPGQATYHQIIDALSS